MTTLLYWPSKTMHMQVNFSAASGPAAVQGAPYSPLVAPAPAPQLMSARMGDDLASIQVAFDISTNQVMCHSCSLGTFRATGIRLHGCRVE